MTSGIKSKMKSMDDRVVEFEDDMEGALVFKYKQFYGTHWESVLDSSPVKRIKIKDFCDLYLTQTSYPHDRFERLVHYLFDFKIQLFFILEVDIGLYNHLVYNQGYDHTSIGENPYILLKMLCLDQSVILKSRILWERVMNFVYFLETGIELESKAGKSKKGAFFKFVQDSEWSFLCRYRDYIDWFDDKLRTPETHKSSTLRRHFQKGGQPPSEKVMAFLNIVMNVFWENMLTVVRGDEVHSRSWTTGMDNE